MILDLVAMVLLGALKKLLHAYQVSAPGNHIVTGSNIYTNVQLTEKFS